MYDAARDSIDFQIQAPDSVPEGDEVPVILRLLNVTEEPVELRLTGRPVAFDVEVERVGGDIVWRRLHGRAVSMILQLRELAPGEVLEFSAAWEQQTNEGDRAGPGTYRIRGVLPTDQPDPLTTPWAALRIVAR